jgi:prevent-host-death family protein
MKIIAVGEFKSKFSEILDWIRKGEEVIVSYGRKKEEVAVLIDIKKFRKPKKRKLGALNGKVKVKFSRNFKITTEEFLGR